MDLSLVKREPAQGLHETAFATSNSPLDREALRLTDAYWRAANYLSVGQIYLHDNPLLREPLTLDHIKHLIVGHWGTAPGQNFIYVHLSQMILEAVFHALSAQRVLLEGVILKPNMVLEGTDCTDQASAERVADATIQCLLRAVPAAIPGIAFLSGGQSPELASARLNAMNQRSRTTPPWPLAFSFARAIQQPALALWAGDEGNVGLAQAALLHRARCNRASRQGAYDALTDEPT